MNLKNQKKLNLQFRIFMQFVCCSRLLTLNTIKMNQLTFIALCNKYTIEAGIAIENESIINILKNENLTSEEKFNQIDYILGTEF